MHRSRATILRLATLATVVLATALALVLPTSAFAATAIKVAVVRSDITAAAYIADCSLNGSHSKRVDKVVAALKANTNDNLAVTVVGDDVLSDVAKLRAYDVVVLVRNVATIESQRLALRQFASEGGGVVSMFSTSRYDYRPGFSSPYGGSGYTSYHTPYFPFNFWWGFSGSSFMSQSFEYGEISELIGTKFCNDPLFNAGYSLVGASSHPILQMTEKDLGRTSVSFTDPTAQYNETVWPIKNAPITTLLNYSNETVGGKGGIEDLPTRYGVASHMAGWAMPYYYGKVVSYGFQLYDMLNQPTAARMLVNSVKWAGTHGGYGNIRKTPDVSLNAWYTRGQIWATAAVSNSGNIQIRGRLRVDYYRPGATTPFAGCWIKDPNGYIPVSPGERYSDTAGANPSVSSPSGRYRLRVSYNYYDFYRGGWVQVYRDGYLDGTGSGMIWRGQSGLVGPNSARPAPAGSSQLAGIDRYATSVALSKAGWSSVDANSHAVILASGQGFADALAAAPLAGKLHAPILLVTPDTLPSSVSAELTRLYTASPASAGAKLYVVSGLQQSVVSAASSAIANAGSGGRNVDVVSLVGSDRYDTARLIAEQVKPAGSGGTAFIVTGENYADALSIAPVAAKLQQPILFVDSTVQAPTAEALSTIGITHCVIVGGTPAVSANVEAALESSGRRQAADARLQGPTRYDTCLAVLAYAKVQAAFSDASLYVATGTNYPDALALAPLAAAKSTPVLLVNGSDIANSAADAGYLLGRRTARPPVTFVGGTPAVSAYVRGQLGVALTP